MNRRHFLSTTTAAFVSPLFLRSHLRAQNDQKYDIGIFTRPWAKFDYLTAFDEIAKAEFKNVGLMTTKSKDNLLISKNTNQEQSQKIGEQAAERGLDIVSVYGGDFDSDKDIHVAIKSLKKLIDNCAACRGQNLLLGGTSDKNVFENYYNTIKACCDYAQKQGIQLVLKPHGGLNATGPQCAEIIQRVNHNNFGLWYDPGNILYYSENTLNPINDVSSVDGLVTGLCVKDYLHPKNVDVTPGTGIVDFEPVFDKLKNGGFCKGPLVIECLKPGNLEELQTEALQSRKFLEELIKNKG